MTTKSYLHNSATRASTALSVMRAELIEAHADVRGALALIERLIAEVGADRHPLFLPEESPRDRWPLRPHWDGLAVALGLLAGASGAQVDCAQKWNRMRVMAGEGRTVNLTMALAELADFVEAASDMDNEEVRAALRACVPVHQSAGHGPYIVLADIPQTWRDEFFKALRGSAAPLVKGAGPCAWPVDWERWLEADWREAWRRKIPLTVRDVMAALSELPPELPVMLPAEGGIDYAYHVRVANVANHASDWTGTPVGRYVEMPDSNAKGKPFNALLLAFDPLCDLTWLEGGNDEKGA